MTKPGPCKCPICNAPDDPEHCFDCGHEVAAGAECLWCEEEEAPEDDDKWPDAMDTSRFDPMESER